MDWSRAKSVLIFIFIALNIFLTANLSFIFFKGNVSAETISNTEEILENRDITLKDCKIPRYNRPMGRLKYENGKYDKARIINKLFGSAAVPAEILKDGGERELASGSKKLTFKSDNTLVYKDSEPSDKVNISDDSEIEKYVRDFLKSLKLPVSEYYLDMFKRNPDSSVNLTFREKYRDFLIYDNYVEAVVTKDGITYLSCRFKKIEGFTSDKQDIIPAYQILLKNFIDNGTVITGIDLGFKGDNNLMQDTREYYERPVWRIKTEDGAVRYFNAYNGEEIKV